MVLNILIRFKHFTKNSIYKCCINSTIPIIVQLVTQNVLSLNRNCHCQRPNHESDFHFIDFSKAITGEEKCNILQNMLVIDSFLSPDEEKTLLGEIEPYMKRLRYEFDHWDNVSNWSHQ